MFCSRRACVDQCPQLLSSVKLQPERLSLHCRALMSVCNKIGTPGEVMLERYRPREYRNLVSGRSMAAVGCEPILHMRSFQKAGKLPESLVADVLARNTDA